MNRFFDNLSLNRSFLHRLVCFFGLAGALSGVVACGTANASNAAHPTATYNLPTQESSSSVIESATPLPAPTDTPLLFQTLEADPVEMPTATPTAQDKAEPTLGYYNITPFADATLVTPIPTPVIPIEIDQDLVNVLLIGTDYRVGGKGFRTDTLIVVSINKSSGLVTMLSIPRDLYVYIPTWGMARINNAYADGQTGNYPGGGPGLLKQTLLYNLGIPIHYYALVNFDGFQQIVDTLGGVDVPVNCQLTDYKLKDSTLSESNLADYELYTIPVGMAHMDGALALWFARVRPVGGDFFRSYRQRQVLRAIYHTGLNANLIPQIPDLYASFNQVVQTDMGLWDIMQFTPLTARLDDTQIRSLHIGPNQTAPWITPKGEEVLVPQPDRLKALIDEAFTPPSANQLTRSLTQVEIWNTTPNVDWDELAAETLGNEGFAPLIGQPDGSAYEQTTLIDFTTSAKGSPLKKLQYYLHIEDKNVVAQPDSNSPVPFRVILGNDYNPCPRVDWMDNSANEAASTPTP
jgi:polyisoprenyl-teichoic acid--peptidoglycan teichoic acid transferase